MAAPVQGPASRFTVESFTLPGGLADSDDRGEESALQAAGPEWTAVSDAAKLNATASSVADVRSSERTAPPAPDQAMPTPPLEPPPQPGKPNAEVRADPPCWNACEHLFMEHSQNLQDHIGAYRIAQEQLLDGLIRECFTAGVQAALSKNEDSCSAERGVLCHKSSKDASDKVNGAQVALPTCNTNSSFGNVLPHAYVNPGQAEYTPLKKHSSFSYNHGRLVFVQKDSHKEKIAKVKRVKKDKTRPTVRRTPYMQWGLHVFRILSYWQSTYESIGDSLKIVVPLEEPDSSRSCLGLCVTSDSFHFLCFCVIIFDAIFTSYALNQAAQSGQERHTASTQIVNLFILAFYLAELVVKLIVFGKFFFLGRDSRWNWFDAALVLQSIVSMVVDFVVSLSGKKLGEGSNITFIRMLRLLKLAKIFRLFRVIQFLRELRIMLVTIANSLTVLFWAFVTLGMVLYMFSLIFVQAMSGYIIDSADKLDQQTHDLIRLYFGSVQASALTLYQCTSNGVDWISIYDLIQLCGWFYAAAFIFFIGFFNFAVLNILTGIFLDKALHAATPDRDAMALEQRRREELLADELRELLVDMDEDESGTLSLDEFISKTHDDYVQAYLTTLGLNIQDAKMFFSLLCRFSRKSELPIEEFVWRCARMKGDATSLDLQGVAYEVSLIHDNIRGMCRALGIYSEDEDVLG